MLYSAGQEVWILKHNLDIFSWFYLFSHLFMQMVIKTLMLFVISFEQDKRIVWDR